MKTIAIANQKGGTGKTTTTYNLGIALTQQGYRVLMVDFDPQGNLSCYCGIPPEKDLDQTITELLMKTSCEKPIGNRECVYQTGRKEAAARVDFIPSNLRLAGFELAMGTMMCREVGMKLSPAIGGSMPRSEPGWEGSRCRCGILMMTRRLLTWSIPIFSGSISVRWRRQKHTR